MSAPEPVDQPERDRVRTDHEHTLFVEAAAGTGKTQALVDRVVALVARGAHLRELAAITFTEAAAAELRDRIRAALETAAIGDDSHVADGEEQRRCRDALDEVDDAALSTLHGFAQRILADHPLEAGLPPAFDVLDEVAAGVRFEQQWRAFVDRVLGDDALSELVAQGLALGLAPDVLRQVAKILGDNYDRVSPKTPEPATPPPLELETVLEPLDRALSLAGECDDATDKLAVHLTDVRTARAGLDAAVDDLDRLDLVTQWPRLSSKLGQRNQWRVPVDDVRGLLGEAEAARVALLEQRRRLVVGALLDRVVAWVHEQARARADAGELEFHDLLVLARDLLARDPEVRGEVGHRYRHLLLDEFQDTDPLQIEIAALIVTADPQALATGWSAAVVEPGRLFLVGDPKQSIYRFRRADLQLYLRVAAELPHEPVQLRQSFRSVPALLDLVNAVFRTLLEAAAPDTQAAPVDLAPLRPALGGDAPVVAVFGDESDELVAEIRRREADNIASLLQRVVDERWDVEDPTSGARRPARLADIAILLPTRTVLPTLEDALERHDISARIESQSLVFATTEVRDLLSVLTAIDDPTDEVAVVAALRSPGLGCSDRDLVEFRRAGGRWDYRRPAPDDPGAAPAAVGAMARLAGFHQRRWWQSVSETVAMVVSECRLLELACARRRPRDNWRRIRFLLDQARAWDDAGRSALRGFVEWVQLQADERARAVEVVAPEPDDDAVRILTVHGAKGLEFPIVVLAGLSVEPSTRKAPVVFGDDGTVEVRVGSRDMRVETAAYDALLAREDAHEAAERVRLLYVAMTRARDRLLVSLHRKAGRTRCDAAALAPLLEPGTPRLDIPAARPPRPPSPAGPPPPDADPAARERWRAERDALLARAGRPATIAATTLAHGDALDPAARADGGDATDERPPWQRGRAGTALGRAVHAVLQTIDLTDGADLDPTARAQALAEALPERVGEVRALVSAVLEAPAVRAAVASNRYWREVPVGAEVDGAVVEGFIDLLYEGPDGLVVVDYKTDRVGDDELDDLLARYRVQGATYALALEAALRRPVAQVVFVFARPGGAAERAVDDLPATVAEVRRRLELVTAS